MKATYWAHMGDDLMVANVARVSFRRHHDRFVTNDDAAIHNHGLPKGHPDRVSSDEALLGYLARGMSSGEWSRIVDEIVDADNRDAVLAAMDKLKADPHWSPFAHPHITLHMRAPVWMRTQCFKHKVGFAENEVSRRYVDDAPTFYVPERYSQRPRNRKQGADGPHARSGHWLDQTQGHHAEATYLYHRMIRDGVAPEEARGILPQNMYTEWVWTGSLIGYARFYRQRTDSHAQQGTGQLAQQVADIIRPLYPHSWAALCGGAA